MEKGLVVRVLLLLGFLVAFLLMPSRAATGENVLLEGEPDLVPVELPVPIRLAVTVRHEADFRGHALLFVIMRGLI